MFSEWWAPAGKLQKDGEWNGISRKKGMVANCETLQTFLAGPVIFFQTNWLLSKLSPSEAKNCKEGCLLASFQQTETFIILF